MQKYLAQYYTHYIHTVWINKLTVIMNHDLETKSIIAATTISVNIVCISKDFIS